MAVQEDVDFFVLASLNPAQNRKSKQIAFLFAAKQPTEIIGDTQFQPLVVVSKSKHFGPFPPFYLQKSLTIITEKHLCLPYICYAGEMTAMEHIPKARHLSQKFTRSIKRGKSLSFL